MRATIDVDEGLLGLARQAAVIRGASLGEIVDDALRAHLTVRPAAARGRQSRPLVTFRGRGPKEGIDLSSNAALADALEAP